MKGQLESVGLVIIVVLIVILLLFALVFTTKKEVRSESSVSVRADNLINAITKVEINRRDIREGVAECCEGSCDDFRQGILEILDRSLEENYFFSISKGSTVCEEIGSCRLGITSSKYRLRHFGEQYEISVTLC